MKVLFIVGVVVVVAILALFAGIAIGFYMNVNAQLKELGFTKASRKIYVDAVKLLNRMTRITELDGEFAADLLSEKTKAQINELLTRYRKEVNEE